MEEFDFPESESRLALSNKLIGSSRVSGPITGRLFPLRLRRLPDGRKPSRRSSGFAGSRCYIRRRSTTRPLTKCSSMISSTSSRSTHEYHTPWG